MKTNLKNLCTLALFLCLSAIMYGQEEWPDPIAWEFAQCPNDWIFFQKVQKAFEADDVNWLAKQMEYPLPVAGLFGRFIINNEAQFKELYPAIKTDRFMKILSEVREPKDIHESWRGISIGYGNLWYDYVYDSKRYQTGSKNNPGTYKVTSLNVIYSAEFDAFDKIQMNCLTQQRKDENWGDTDHRP